MGGDLLQKKRAPPFKLFGAVVIAIALTSGLLVSLHLLQDWVGGAFGSGRPTPAMMMMMMMLGPCSLAGVVLYMGLVIPLGVYVFDHSAFQSLNVLRPDHFVRMVANVWRAWAPTGSCRRRTSESFMVTTQNRLMPRRTRLLLRLFSTSSTIACSSAPR
jgi:hypothetical protein